ERRLAGIGVADQRNDREWNLASLGAMQVTRAPDSLQLALDAHDPILQQSPVSLDLRFTRTTHEATATALALKVGPAAHEASALIFEMREIDLQPAFLGARPAAEDFKDEPGAIQNLGLELALKIALLNRRKLMVDDDELRPVLLDDLGKLGKL